MATSVASQIQRKPLEALQKAAAFARLPAEEHTRLLSVGAWTSLNANEALGAKAGPEDAEAYHFIVHGQLALVLQHPRPIIAGLSEGNRPLRTPGAKILRDPKREYVALLTEGEVVSDAFVTASRPPSTSVSDPALSIVALVESVLFTLPALVLRGLMDKYSEFAADLAEQITEQRRSLAQHASPDLKVAQDFFLRHGYSFAKTLRVIDLDLCVNCDACEKACEDRHGQTRLARKGPVLGRLAFPVTCRTCVDHRCVAACGFDACTFDGEVRVNTKKCVGCTACEQACPNDVISMVKTPYTAADFPNPLPATDPAGQTNIPGMYLVGEASGDALIKLAINAGKKAVDDIANRLSGLAPAGSGILDVVVVGAGPAGLSAALACKEKNLAFSVFDKGHYATTLMNYPRHKVVMAEPAHIPLYGSLWLENTTKEQMIEKWGEVIKKSGLVINSHEPVTDVKKGDDGIFTVTTSKGSHRSRSVLLAPGNRGAPRKLGVKGEAEPRVQYQVTDPEAFAGKHALVVGGGDSAVEAAMSLADVPNTKVSISYRKDSFGRIKKGNKDRLDQYSQDGKVRVLLSSSVAQLSDGQVVIKIENAPDVELLNDVIFALLGADPPTKFFEKLGIQIAQPDSPEMTRLAQSRGERAYSSKCDHCKDYGDQACVTACPTGAIEEMAPGVLFFDVVSAAKRRTLNTAPFVLGFSALPGRSAGWIPKLVAGLTVLCAAAISLECIARRVLPEHSLGALFAKWSGAPAPMLASGSGLGFYLGIAGTLLMAATTLYPLHSRLGLLRRFSKTRLALYTHILFGFLGPVFVACHTLLKLDRWPAMAFWAMVLVVLSGLAGRHLFTHFRKNVGLAELEREAHAAQHAKLMEQWAQKSSGGTRMMKVASVLNHPHLRGGLLLPVRLVFSAVRLRLLALWWRTVRLRGIRDTDLRDQTVDSLLERGRAERGRVLHELGQNAVGMWKRAHVALTVVLFVVTSAHVVVALLFKAT